MKRWRFAAAAVAITLAGIVPAGHQEPAGAAVNLPPGFSQVAVASTGLFSPTILSAAPDGRIFLSLQKGRIRVIKNGALLTTPFLDLTDVVESSGDRGMLGVAFDPNFAVNQYVYVYYTAKLPSPHHRISRFTANGDVAVAGSEMVLMDLPPLGTSVLHNGGTIHFGPDGKLYIAVGDNVIPNDNPQRLDTTFGKMLRINKDGTIPTDNPFYDQTTGINRSIWAMGLRNPYTWGMSRSGQILMNDVGSSLYEEINEGQAGANYGQPIVKGPAGDPRFMDPVAYYTHGDGPDQGCSTIGGAFYEPTTVRYPAHYVGRYFTSDYCGGWIKTLDPDTYTWENFATGVENVVSVTMGADGHIYYVSRPDTTSGVVYRIDYATNTPPSIVDQPDDISVAPGQTATFSVSASGAAPLTYQWRRNGTAITGATSSSYTTPPVTAADNGDRFSVRVTNGFGNDLSADATLTVTAGTPPVPTFTKPSLGKTYKAGDTIPFAGTATDAEDGTLPASAFSWDIVFHHDTHTHEFTTPPPGSRSGSFVAPVNGFESDANVFFRIYLTVTDSDGMSSTTTRDVVPQLGQMRFNTSPSGLTVSIDGTPTATPTTITGVRNYQRTIGVTSPQLRNGQEWVFDAWSDRGAQQHTISTPGGASSFTAVMRRTAGSVGNGTGLTGTYFDNADLTGATATRIDRNVLFTWPKTASPISGIAPGSYSVRWTGQVMAQFSAGTKFYVQADDGARLWVNGVLVIDRWGPNATMIDAASAKIPLTAGTLNTIRLETRQGSGRSGQARLYWSNSSLPKSIIPGSQLFPT